MIDYWIMVRDNVALRSRRGAAPVPGPVPAGVDIRETDEFKWLEAEVRRMDVDGPTAVDWIKVNTLSLNILSNRSKDILIGCWATYGSFRIEGYEGLAVGLGILRGMMYAHWEQLFPPIKQQRARLEAVDWLVTRLGPELARNVPIEADSSAVIVAYDALDDLARQLGGKLVNEQAAFAGLLRALHSHYEKASREIATAAERAAETIQAAKRTEAALVEPTSPVPLNQQPRV
ncbi:MULTISPECIES: type VI secretion system ImpA family N-terminal domain-containing protein [unclassified Bradyrhizobium]|uniref:type VI secretion system ImpA family N-terminal domain-containing protein n=1 Tax=unclassified Bradyrhizobium TaxID=2631580 RepID=UPI00247A7D9B|nr:MULTISPECIES: type VI secretion system ImpA family N-terminal domain-containing protein [unclassified Bradyrhizobium]WGS19129.1 type VI secretion system ImpA family N-terminal domain-containing protein [Bradyrhizobium sp. ISRA463]WGS25967.1 type VI secretion system ImpA family N-terminal domain-containing protein [Bradyrhizobium sp. ISRA464]